MFFAFALLLGAGSFASPSLLRAEPAANSNSNSSSSATATSAAGNLATALDAIKTDNIRSDIFFIASDELEGRDTPSPGQRIAARYIRARLERLGFQPGAENGYLYEYPLLLPRLDESKCATKFAAGGVEQEWKLGVDFFLQARGLKAADLEGEVVFCGSGRRSDVPKNVTGKWALCFDEGKTVGDVEKALTEAGAIGVLMTPAPNYDKKPYSERFANEVRILAAADVTWPVTRRDSEPSVPMLMVTPEAAARLAPEVVGENAKKSIKPGHVLAARFAHKRAFVGDDGIVQCENVCGYWPGSDAKLKDEVIVISAHYDHVGWRGRTREIHNGADDNGSGTTGLLALAEALVAHGPLRRSVLLVWVSGEEKGLYGSKAWTEKPWLPGDARAVCNINIDMIGRNAPDKLLITPTQKRAEYNGLVRIAEDECAKEGFPTLGSCDTYWDRSDHANFARNLKIPVAFLFSDVHEDYHKPGDDPEKIDYDKIRRVSRLVMRIIANLQDNQLKL
jgi:hypothetical protein